MKPDKQRARYKKPNTSARRLKKQREQREQCEQCEQREQRERSMSTMNLKEPQDWVRTRDALDTMFMRALFDYIIHMGVLPADAGERRNFHLTGGAAISHATRIRKLAQMIKAEADLVSAGLSSGAALEAALNQARAAMAAEKEGDMGHDPACDAA
ncbi:MAG: hypothetical protein ACYYKD_04895 [Rhodospirillales bacterium]